MQIGLYKVGIMICVGLSSSFNIQAHEYWLDPIDSSVEVGESVIVDIRNGQNFAGVSFPFDPSKVNSVVVSSASNTRPYQGRLGDYPAIHPELINTGLHSIAVETVASLLVYKSWSQFNGFVSYHGLDSVVSQHKERNLPEQEIKERYYRSAKTLVQANDEGAIILAASQAIDPITHEAFAATGATFEMILLDNPYSTSKQVRTKLLFKGQPLAGRQVEMFWKGSQEIRLTTLTDIDGIAVFKLLGSGDYLLNAVHVVDPNNDNGSDGVDKDVHWISHWASMTFER